jgi:hypothetical protein
MVAKVEGRVYLGRLPQHGRNVALVMDRDTALVSPQFHVVFYATFDTMKTIKTRLSWQLRAGFVTTQKKPMNKEITSPHKKTASMTNSSNKKKRKRHTSDEIGTAGDPVASKKKEPAAANVGDDGPPKPFNTTKMGNSVMGSATERIGTKFGRTVKQVQRTLAVMCTEISEATRSDVEGEIFCYVAMFPHYDRWSYRDPLLAYKAVSDPDTLYYHQAMREKDKEKFQESMMKDVTDQFNNGNFPVIPRSEVPK